jgi:hypothetical protein
MIIRRLALSLAAGAVLLLAAPPALAEDHPGTSTVLALDLNYAGPISEPGVDGGPGGAIRFGQQLDLALIQLTGELGAGYQPFNGTPSPKLYSGFLGGRLALGKILEPGIFGHIGVAHLSAGTGAVSRTAPLLDVGLFLDLTVLPLVNVGVHGGYNVMTPSSNQNAFHYYDVGVNGALVF